MEWTKRTQKNNNVSWRGYVLPKTTQNEDFRNGCTTHIPPHWSASVQLKPANVITGEKLLLSCFLFLFRTQYTFSIYPILLYLFNTPVSSDTEDIHSSADSAESFKIMKTQFTLFSVVLEPYTFLLFLIQSLPYVREAELLNKLLQL